MKHPEGPFRQVPFDHRQHVKFAWAVVQESGSIQANHIVSEEIEAFAAENAPGKYHQTLTTFWVRLVAHTMSVDSTGSFEEHLSRFPILSDKRAAWRHYSDSLLMSDPAREQALAPDLVPLP